MVWKFRNQSISWFMRSINRFGKADKIRKVVRNNKIENGIKNGRK